MLKDQKLFEELAHIPVERWQSSKLWKRSTAPEVRWFRVACLKPILAGPLLELGLTRNGDWVVTGSDQSIFPVESEGDYLPLFPLLEMSYEEARKALHREFSTHQLSADWLGVFPFQSLIVSALRSDSRFWPDNALRWVEESEVTDAVGEALSFLQRNGKTQRQRHQAMKLLFAHRRSNPG